MLYSRFLFRLGWTLLLICTLSFPYIYLYPLFHRCAFSVPPSSARAHGQETKHAPFRLLAFGDPQLEGDSSLPNPEDPLFPSIRQLFQHTLSEHFGGGSKLVQEAFIELATKDIPKLLRSYRKRLDLLGNDYYLAHIYRTLHWWTKPTHVTVLGDLLGSQWINDDEFARRAWRFWNKVFSKGERVEHELSGGARVEILGQDERWARRVINVAGNHDIGYAGDLNEARISRFEKAFGPVNWEVRFQLPNSTYPGRLEQNSEVAPEIRIVVLNSMNIDSLALSQSLQQDTYQFINNIITSSRPVEDRRTLTLLLTHIPLHKDDGTCSDAPFFDFYGAEAIDGAVKEQNHISYDNGKAILEGIYGMSSRQDAPARGMGRNGIILTGHDHEGCDVYHYSPPDASEGEKKWKTARWPDAGPFLSQGVPGIREITVRSMMGDYGGNAGLLSAWFDESLGEWRVEYSSCAVGVQHIWWAVHVTGAITLLVIFCAIIVRFLEGRPREQRRDTVSATFQKDLGAVHERLRASTRSRRSVTPNRRGKSGSRPRKKKSGK